MNTVIAFLIVHMLHSFCFPRWQGCLTTASSAVPPRLGSPAGKLCPKAAMPHTRLALPTQGGRVSLERGCGLLEGGSACG